MMYINDESTILESIRKRMVESGALTADKGDKVTITAIDVTIPFIEEEIDELNKVINSASDKSILMRASGKKRALELEKKCLLDSNSNAH